MQAVLIASGSEVSLALDAQKQLHAEGIPVRVVSMPSLELFAQQSSKYRDQVLPPSVPARLAIEAGHPQSWYRWVGGSGAVLGLDHFGASAPAKRLFAEFGLDVDGVVKRVKALVEQ